MTTTETNTVPSLRHRIGGLTLLFCSELCRARWLARKEEGCSRFDRTRDEAVEGEVCRECERELESQP